MSNEESVRRESEIAEVKNVPSWVACFNEIGVFVEELAGMTSEPSQHVGDHARGGLDRLSDLAEPSALAAAKQAG